MSRWYEENPMVRGALLPLLVVLAVGSAIGVVYLHHHGVQLYIALQGLQKGYGRALEEQGRLRLEEATWGNLARIEHRAAEELNMHYPEAAQRIVVH